MSLTFLSLLLLLLLRLAAAVSPSPLPFTASLYPSDAVSLLSFKSSADLDNRLLYSLTERFDYCQWRGVKCAQGRVVRLALSGAGLRGSISPNTLSRLDQLRVLSLDNNSLSGLLPDDLTALINLKSLILSRNVFSGSFPVSLLSLRSLTVLDLSFNNFSGPLPVQITGLDRLAVLSLQFNRFNGTLPPLNQSFLVFFNVSGNNLSGPIPATATLSRFGASSFSSNPGLCGEVINRACASRAPFFGPANGSESPAPLGQSAEAQSGGRGGGAVVLPPVGPPARNRNGGGLVLGFTIGVAVLIALGISIVAFSLITKKRRDEENEEERRGNDGIKGAETPLEVIQNVAVSSKKGEKVESLHHQEQQQNNSITMARGGNLVFCGGQESKWNHGMYTLEQLMRASAELLGRGSLGTTYKAVLDNQLIVTVKRLDANKTAITSGEAFEAHMGIVGALRHPNLVDVRAYFQAKGERLVIYDYQPNGSLFNLIHGSRSSRAKPLHWTSCLKIAEDVVQGLAYIHQSSTLVHGNLKSTNILLGPDFEACITDYCLNILADTSISVEDPDSSAYKAPETRKSARGATAKSDVYSFGVLLLELMTGKHPSQHPFMSPHDMLDWVRATRDEDDGQDDARLGMLTEVACICRVTSPEQRPAIWQVMKMIQEIKESVMIEDNGVSAYS